MEDKTKLNQKPSDLIGIISPFSEEIIDDLRLAHGDVREDYRTSKRPTLKRIWAGTLFLSTFFGTLASIFYSFKDPWIGIPLASSLGYLHVKTIIAGMPKNPKDFWGYDEFNKLWEASQIADSFIKRKYLPNFIALNLEEK